ncbi:type II/IV secretion system ATPase subunit [Candidatus Aenigmatarchaeota archaeon]
MFKFKNKPKKGIENKIRRDNKKSFGSIFGFKKKKKIDYPKFQIFPQKGLIPLPSSDDIRNKAVMYSLIKPYAYSAIKFSEKSNIVEYKVIEPTLGNKEYEMLEILREGLIQVINISLENVKKRGIVIDFLEENVRKLIDAYGFELTKQEYIKIMYYIFRDFVGLGKIEPLLSDPYIEDIGCDGTNIPVYVIHQKYGSIRTNVIFQNEKDLRDFVIKLAERSDRYISYAEPLLDGTLPGGTRVHASIARDVTTRGPTFTLRKFRETPFTPIDILNLKTVSSEMLAYLWFVVENGANLLVTGGVATGKTSFLNSISMFIPTEAKIVSIEDTRELNLPHENWIPGVSRSGFTGSGVGEVTMFELLKESFRQNPDYLIVGEVRGREAYIMFQGMASGHPSMATVHSGGVEDLIKRLQTKPISLSAGLLESLDIVITMVHAKEKTKSSRRAREIVEIESIDIETGVPRVNKVFAWQPYTDSFEFRGNSWLLHRIAREKGYTLGNVMSEIARRKKVIDWLQNSKITDMNQVVNYIKLYRTNPTKVENIMRTAV